MGDQFEEVRPFNWVASRQHEDWNLQLRNFVDQVFALLCAELHRISIRLSGCAAVHTREITGLSHFPDGDEWLFVKIDRLDLPVHELMRQLASAQCSDQSLRLPNF